MKKVIIYINLLLLNLFLYGCQDLDDLNENPNYVNETHPQLLLTEIAAKTFQVEGTNALYASRMLIQTGEENNYQYFKWGNGSFDNYNDLRQVTKMIEEAQRIGNLNYEAIGKFFRAHYFYRLTLQFGDIPYSEALQGEDGTYKPAYDSQEVVFEGIIAELDEASSMIVEEGQIDGDIIYGGDALKWKKLINSFELKVLLTLSNKEQVGSFDVAEKFRDVYNRELRINSLADNAQLVFIDQQGSRYTEFNSSSYGSSMFMSATFVDLLQDLEDPRLFIVADQTPAAGSAGLAIDDFEAYNGGDPSENYSVINETLVASGEISKVNDRYYTDPTNEPHNILSYWEVEFILAEAAARGWINDPSTHYQNAIRANFEFYRTYAEEYAEYMTEDFVDQYLNQDQVALSAGNEELTIEKILTEKYLTSFLQGGWTQYYDYLRTGYPKFAYLPGSTPPVRFVYPIDEYNNNTENVDAAINSQFGGNDGIRQLTWWLK